MNFPFRTPVILLVTPAIIISQTYLSIAQNTKLEEFAKKVTVLITTPNPQYPDEIVYRGSGVIINRKGNNYYILTNAHVINSPLIEHSIKFNIAQNSPSYPAQTLTYLPDADLAVLKFTSKQKYTVACLGYATNIVNSPVFVAGWRKLKEIPEWTFSRGIPQTDEQGNVSYKDIIVGPGMSGGPVFTEKGQLIGIHTSQDKHDEKKGWAIPINRIRDDLPSDFFNTDKTCSL